MRYAAILTGAVLTLGILGGAQGYAQDITRTVLQKWEIPETPAYDITTLRVVIKAGGTSGRHTHPGVESSYVISGEPVLKVDGKADQTLAAGDSFMIAPGAVHEVLARGSEPVVLVLSYVTERGKPLVSQVP